MLGSWEQDVWREMSDYIMIYTYLYSYKLTFCFKNKINNYDNNDSTQKYIKYSFLHFLFCGIA